MTEIMNEVRGAEAGIKTAARMALVDRVAELGPGFAARAEAVDRDASFPYENWEDLKQAGLLGITIPKEKGGQGGDFVGYALASEELARHCPSTALTFNMHVATTLLVGEVADSLDLSPADQDFLTVRREALWSGIIDDHHIHSQPFSEGLNASATAGYATRAEPVDGGYLVSGRKIFASLSEASTFHNVLCMVEGDPRLRLIGVPHRADGVTIEGDWDPLGMRGTDSRTLVMEKVFVPEEYEWLPPGAFNTAADRWPYFYMTLSFSYLGLMRGVLDFTEQYLKAGDRRSHPIKQQGWAEMNIAYETAQALCYRALGEVTVDPTPDQLIRAWSSMVTTMERCPEVASTAIRVCGGRSMLRPSYLERAYRDARCGATMLPWSVEVCLQRLGTARLFDQEETD